MIEFQLVLFIKYQFCTYTLEKSDHIYIYRVTMIIKSDLLHYIILMGFIKIPSFYKSDADQITRNKCIEKNFKLI